VTPGLHWRLPVTRQTQGWVGQALRQWLWSRSHRERSRSRGPAREKEQALSSEAHTECTAASLSEHANSDTERSQSLVLHC
jgi:hypothetical protein